jgi:hypothetical protein
VTSFGTAPAALRYARRAEPLVLEPVPTDAIACLGGREYVVVSPFSPVPAGECRASLRHDRVLVAPTALVAGDHYLADVAREIGRERFQTFGAPSSRWTVRSPPPCDSR